MDVIDVHAPMGEPAPAAAPRPCRVQFTGTGQEYFRIWIVNLLLTIATVGIYSAWAKVRKLQYFYRNTHLDGSGFAYHGDPVAILKGRLLAGLLLVLYQGSLHLLGTFALIAVLGLIAVLPWMLAQSYRFRLHNSSYRGLRFRFAGPIGQAYLIFGLPMLLVLVPSVLGAAGMGGDPRHPNRGFQIGFFGAYIALMLLWPYLHFSFKRWQHGHAFFGTARARFEAGAFDFYAPYLLAGLMLVTAMSVGGVLIWAFRGAPGPAPARGLGLPAVLWVVFVYGTLLMAAPFVSAWIQNAVWSGTRLEGVRFESQVRAGRLIGITLTNLLMIVASIGLLIPFAVMRVMKYKIESIQESPVSLMPENLYKELKPQELRDLFSYLESDKPPKVRP